MALDITIVLTLFGIIGFFVFLWTRRDEFPNPLRQLFLFGAFFLLIVVAWTAISLTTDNPDRIVNQTVSYSPDYFEFDNDSVTCVLCNFSAPVACGGQYPSCSGACPDGFYCNANGTLQACQCEVLS